MVETLPSPASTTSRASFKPGTVYAVDGKDGWVYFAEVTARDFAFLHHRARSVSMSPVEADVPILCRFSIGRPSVGRALRVGHWLNLGRRPLLPTLETQTPRVQWPHSTSSLTVWMMQRPDGGPTFETTIDGPAIQDMELMISWDAVDHVAPRLRLEFGSSEPDCCHIGGPVWRERRVAAEIAKRHPDNPAIVQRAIDARLRLDH